MAILRWRDGQAGLPTKNSTSSWWHREPSELLQGYRGTSDLPPQADTVVIGSGITGAFGAMELLEGFQSQGVVMLDAREACWGATGRNGGHCQPLVYLKSAEVARFELATCSYLNSLVTEKKIDCDWQIVGGVHPIATRNLLLAIRKRIDSIEKHHPDLSGKAQLIEGEEQLRALKVQNAIGAVYQPLAAKCWPYKLVSWVLEDLIRQHDVQTFNLQTNTSALGLQKLQDGGWIVHTDRGQITTKKILLATNAYISQLLPSFTGLVVPTRGQACALRSPLGGSQLEHSYGWLDNEAGDDYLIQRDNGPLIFGGERLLAKDNEVGVWWDDDVDEEVGKGLRRAIGKTLKLQDDGPEQEELEATCEWTGIMGYSKDDCPWVGEVPTTLGGGEGLWICAGYTGHGMPVAARCGIAVAQMMMGRTHGAIEVPDVFKITDERVEKVKNMKESMGLADELDILTAQDEAMSATSRFL